MICLERPDISSALAEMSADQMDADHPEEPTKPSDALLLKYMRKHGIAEEELSLVRQAHQEAVQLLESVKWDKNMAVGLLNERKRNGIN